MREGDLGALEVAFGEMGVAAADLLEAARVDLRAREAAGEEPGERDGEDGGDGEERAGSHAPRACAARAGRGANPAHFRRASAAGSRTSGRDATRADRVRPPALGRAHAGLTLCSGHIPSPRAMARKKISTTIYITPEQNERLKLLNDRTKVPVAEYIRQGIDLVLERYRANLPGQLTLDDVGGKK